MRKRHLVTTAVLLALGVAGWGCGGEAEETGGSFAEILPGLSYVDSLMGTGELVGATDFVQVHYTGWLYVEGQKTEKFDSSVDRGEPIALRLGQSRVIQGWDKGLPGMKVGGKRTLLISPEMAYGEQGRSPVIPPSSTLLFDVEIVGILRVDVETLAEGKGPQAEAGDTIDVHYTGWLWENGAKGDEFDSSLSRETPFTFPLGGGRVIPGWDMALEGMKVGQKARLIIPPELGYGRRGSPPKIPPQATLCFEVELMAIQGK